MNEQNTQNLSDEMLDRDGIKKLLRISDVTIWRYLKNGALPQPTIDMTSKKQWWNKKELFDYLTKNSKK